MAKRLIIFLISTIVAIAAGQITMLAQSSGATPILLIVDDSGAYKWGRYLGEILRTEGISSYNVLDLDDLDASALSSRNLIILAQTHSFSGAQATTLSDYVSGGGNLIAMRPASSLLPLFGLGASQGALTDGYVRIDASANVGGKQPGAGLTPETLQIHGDTDRYALGSAVMVAQLYSDATTSTTHPAVASNASGSAVAFLYDLASNVILTRQGNPANASVDTDNDSVLRTIDLFQTSGGGAPWVDRDKIHIPQADEQQRLFARLVRQAVEKGRPLPQVWYFPDGKLSVLIPTSDAHANPIEYFDNLINSVNGANGSITIYLTPWAGLPVMNADIQGWIAQGHEFGIHPASVQPATAIELVQGYQEAANFYAGRYTTSPSRTVRHHQVTWVGWTDAADIAVNYGLALDTNFYHWGPWIQKPDGTWPHGYITGSGQPMKFMRQDGTILPYYQQLTQLVDEQFFPITDAGYENLLPAQAAAVSAALIDASLAGDYAAIMTQFHVDYSSWGEVEPWIGGTLNYAHSKGVPIWTAGRWLDFVERRFATSYTNSAWNSSSGIWTFDTAGPTGSGFTLATMLPVNYDGRGLQAVRVDGVTVPVYYQFIDGQPFAFVNTVPGNHSFRVTYESAEITVTPGDPPPPTETPTNPEPSADVQVAITALPVTASINGQLTYSLRVFNAGPNQAANIQLQTALPTGTTFLSVIPSNLCSLDNGTLFCNWDALNAGKSLLVKLDVQVNAAGPLSITAQVSAQQDDPVFANNQSTLQTGVLPALNAPVVLTPAVLSRSEILLEWIDNSAGQTSAFFLERSPDAANQWQSIAVLPANVLSQIDTNLGCAQSYSYRLRAYRQTDQAYSAWSPVASATTDGCPVPAADIIGLYQNGVWQFWETNGSSQPALLFNFGPQQSGWIPITGDWDGDGTDGIGLYKDGLWLTRSLTSGGAVESIIRFGPAEPGWIPVTGDWDDDGTDGIGLYKDGLFLLRQTMSEGQPQSSFTFGPAESGWKPVAGDWDGNGRASVGVYKDGLWLLSNALPAVIDIPPLAFGPAQPGWMPIAGDWNEDGVVSAGVYRDGLWHLRDSNTSGAADMVYSTSAGSDWYPVANYRDSLSILNALAAPIEQEPTTTPTEITSESTAEVTPEVQPESTEEPTTPAPTLTPSLTPAPTETASFVPMETPTPLPTTTPSPTPEPPEATEAIEPEGNP